MSKINVFNRPHQTELDLEIEHALESSENIKKYLLNMLINKEFNDDNVKKIQYECEIISMLIERIKKGYQSFNLK